jgi:hypothetical protein
MKRISQLHASQTKNLISVSPVRGSVFDNFISEPHRQSGTAVDPGSNKRSNISNTTDCAAPILHRKKAHFNHSGL